MSFDAETAGNFEEIEMQFAVKTVEHLEVCCLLMLGERVLNVLLGIREIDHWITAIQNQVDPVCPLPVLLYSDLQLNMFQALVSKRKS